MALMRGDVAQLFYEESMLYVMSDDNNWHVVRAEIDVYRRELGRRLIRYSGDVHELQCGWSDAPWI